MAYNGESRPKRNALPNAVPLPGRAGATAPRHILRRVNHGPPRNIYFELTEAFDTGAPNVALASGQAVVYYRIAIMSKDGDWIIRETPDASSIGKTLVWMLSDDDVNLVEMSDEELDAAWDLWFDLAQPTNESDPPYTAPWHICRPVSVRRNLPLTHLVVALTFHRERISVIDVLESIAYT
jgi:hypothetical protein